MQYMTHEQIDKIANDTGDALRKEKKARIVIDPQAGSHWEGGINGHFFRIQTGIEVEVPENLAKLIEKSAQVRLKSESSVQAFRGRGKKVG